MEQNTYHYQIMSRAIEAIDADPAGECQGGEFAGDIDANAGAGAAEFEG